MTENYTIGIVGGGAVGLTCAALLSEVANVIVKTRRDEQAALINQQGLTFAKRSGESKDFKNIEASADYDSLIKCDAVIVAVKSYDTEEIAKELSKVLRPETVVLTLQNGLQAFQVLQQQLNHERVFAGVTYVGASRSDERSVVNGDTLRTVVDTRAGKLAELLQSSQFNAELVADSKQAVWDKLVLNAGQNALSAVTDLNFGQMLASQDCLAIAEKLLTEVQRVGEAEGVNFTYSLMDKLRDNWKGSTFRPSMWQDLHKGQRTEIDAINGSISSLGKKHKIATPYNDMITSLIKVLESTKIAQ